MSLRAWDRLLGRLPSEELPGLFDTPPRRTPEEQAVFDEKQRKLLAANEGRRKGDFSAAPTPPVATR